jgi:hypothetical protein
MGSPMERVEPGMDVDEGDEILSPVEFIDGWLEANSFIVDSRSIDFALDLRNLLSDETSSEPDREPVASGV